MPRQTITIKLNYSVRLGRLNVCSWAARKISKNQRWQSSVFAYTSVRMRHLSVCFNCAKSVSWIAQSYIQPIVCRTTKKKHYLYVHFMLPFLLLFNYYWIQSVLNGRATKKIKIVLYAVFNDMILSLIWRNKTKIEKKASLASIFLYMAKRWKRFSFRFFCHTNHNKSTMW